MDLRIASSKIFSANIITAIVSFVGIVYFARILGPSAIGIYFLFEASVRMLGTVANFGVQEAVEKRISEGKDIAEYYTAGLLMNLTFLFMLFFILYLSKGKILTFLDEGIFIYLIWGSMLYLVAHFQNTLLQGSLRVGETVTLTLTHHISWVIFGFIFINLGYGYIGLVYSYILGKSAMLFIGIYKITPSISVPDRELFIDLFKFSKFFFVTSMTRYLYSWVDVLIIGFYLSSAAVGIYEVAWRLAGVTILLSRAIGISIYPQISSYHSENKLERIGRIVSSSSMYSAILIIPALFGVIVISEELLVIIYGSEYVDGTTVLMIIVLGKVFQSQVIVFEKALLGIGRANKSAAINGVTICINIVFNILLVRAFGIEGAAVATMSAYIVSAVFHFIIFNRYINTPIHWRGFIWISLSSIGVYVLTVLVSSVISIDSFLSLITTVGLSCILYGMFLSLNRTFRNRAAKFIEDILR